MRIGIMISSMNAGPADLTRLIDSARELEAMGFAALWMPLGFAQDGGPTLFGHDPITTLAAIALATHRLEIGTAILPIQHRHPVIMAQNALSLSALSGGRFTLGIGNSHQHMVQQVLGLAWEPPVRHMRDYLDTLDRLFAAAPVAHDGAYYHVHGAQMPDAAPVPTLLSAMGPQMLALAGARSGGTITGFTGPKTLESHIVPTISAAAAQAGRPAPRIVASVQFALTDDPAEVRRQAAPYFAGYGKLPSYRAMMDREGVKSAEALIVAGEATVLADAVRHLADIGVTDIVASAIGGATRVKTLECLAKLA